MATATPAPKPRRIEVGFPEAVVEQMQEQLKEAVLPDEPPFPGASWDLGVDLQWLKEVRVFVVLAHASPILIRRRGGYS